MECFETAGAQPTTPSANHSTPKQRKSFPPPRPLHEQALEQPRGHQNPRAPVGSSTDARRRIRSTDERMTTTRERKKTNNKGSYPRVTRRPCRKTELGLAEAHRPRQGREGAQNTYVYSPPLLGGDRVAVQEDRAHDGEELPGGGNRRAHQRVKVADGVVDEVLAQGGCEREAQHVALSAGWGVRGEGEHNRTGRPIGDYSKWRSQRQANRV